MKNLVKTSTTTEIPATPAMQTRENGPSIGFFAVGMVINIALIIAFVVWAIKQGRKRKDEDD